MVSKRFQHQPEAIASYDFAELASKEGILNLYGGETSSAHVLRSNAFYSNVISTFAVAAVTGAFVKYGDESYDVVINAPLIINGDVIITTTSGWNEDGGGANTLTEYLVATLKKVDVDSNVTTLGTDTSTQKQTTGASGFQTRCMKIAISNQNIKIGETIRLQIQHYVKRSAGVDVILAGWGQDPKDRDDDYRYNGVLNGITGTNTTQLILQLPIKIDL